jgi:hypothetical protein
MNTVFTDSDLDALKHHLAEKVEHGWAVWKIEGLIVRLQEAEKICEYAKKMGFNVRDWLIIKGDSKC